MNHKKVLAIAGLVVTAALTLSGCSMKLGGGSSSEPAPTPTVTATATPSPTPDAGKQRGEGKKPDLTEAQLADIIASMTANKGEGIYVCETDKYDNVVYAVESKLSVPDHRRFPDSLGTPIAATDPIGARAELQASICKDSLLRGAWMTFMATQVRDQLLKATGIDLLELNPRLKSFRDVDEIKAYADEIDPLEFLTDAQIKVLSSEAVKEAIAQNAIGQSDASLVNTLLDRFMVSAPEARLSLVNYHLVDYSFGVSQFAKVAINDLQESLPALIFTIVEKGQCGEITSFGANMLDKRPELFAPLPCAPPVTTCVDTNTCTTYTPGCVELGTCNPCPPGNEIPECAPKSTDGSGYVFPGGKTAVGAGTLTGDTLVKTEQTGGGGVLDSSSNNAGTETGVQAGGAGAVGTDLRNFGGNQGGDNGAGDGGGF